MTLTIDEIIENFSYLEDWEDRYRYVIELGRSLRALPDTAHTEENRVRGCASQVWLQMEADTSQTPPKLFWRATVMRISSRVWLL